MPNANYQFLQALAHDFYHDRMESAASRFVVPLPMYVEGDLDVYSAMDNLMSRLAHQRRIMERNGLITIKPRIIAEGLLVNGYSHLWVEWDYLDEVGQSQRTSQVRYVLFHDGLSKFPQIEMVDCKVAAFDNDPDQRLATA